MTDSTPAAARRAIDIDFLYLDLEICTRCRGTDANLETALATVRGVLEAAGADVRVTKTWIDSEQKALSTGFVSSPTLRVGGRDVALEFRESRCESEACACASGSGEAIQCRLWVYQGREYTEAPVPMIVDAVLSAVYGAPAREAIGAPPPTEVPENLRRFFRDRRESQATLCCTTGELETCCAPSQKASCCGAASQSGAGACGCR